MSSDSGNVDTVEHSSECNNNTAVAVSVIGTYSEPMTSYALGGLMGSRQTLLHMLQRPAGGRHGCIKNSDSCQSMHICLKNNQAEF